MRRWQILIVAIVFIGIFVGAFQWYRLRAQRKRNALYQSTLKAFSGEFPPGVTRKIVEDHLRTKGIPIERELGPGSLDTLSDIVVIGYDPTPWFCSSWPVYIAFTSQRHKNTSGPRPTIPMS